ncbi:hypothetical protein AFLA70_53g003880 [Aspergillus flavus AF70]|nr:hypothetical protein AFLA70_53g003880 [Aspergillus flavus AF70]
MLIFTGICIWSLIAMKRLWSCPFRPENGTMPPNQEIPGDRNSYKSTALGIQLMHAQALGDLEAGERQCRIQNEPEEEKAKKRGRRKEKGSLDVDQIRSSYISIKP